MNVLFLDYDGVVNIPMWDKEGKSCRYNHPGDNAVNNFQAVQWVSEFCQKYNYNIVVTSTWRRSDNYKECLINGGLREGVNIAGAVPSLIWARSRGEEIGKYLEENPEVKRYIIFDDEDDMQNDLGLPLSDHLVQCKTEAGITLMEFYRAVQLHKKLYGEEND